MMKKILYLLCILIVSPAFAGGKDVSAFIEQWGNNVFNTCPSHNFPSDAYVADMGEYNAYGGDWNGDFCKVGKGYKIMAALSVTDTGAYFCPVFVYALAPGWNKDTHTRYGRYGGANDCAWLCLPGWTGERCETKSENGTTCDLSELRRENYAKYSGQGTAEAETEIAMFKMDVNQKCYGKNTNAEHDMILAITGFLDNGHGAYVSQVNVVGYRYWGWASNG